MEELEELTPQVRRDTHSAVLGKGTSIMIVSTLALLLLNFVARVVIARGVSPSQWGEFSLGLALTAMLGIIGALGLPNAVARAMAFERTGAGRARLVRTAGIASIVASAVGSGAVFVAAPLLATAFRAPGLTLVFQLFAVSVGCIILSLVLAAFFQGVERAEPNAIFNQIINPALFMIFAAAAIFLHLGFVAVLLSYVLSNVFATVALAFYTARYLPPLLRRMDHDHLPVDEGARVSLLELTITLFGVASLNLLTQYADTIILAIYRSTTVVGEYTTAMTLARLFLVSNSSLMYLYLPVAARLRSTGDMTAVRRSYVTTARWTVATTVPLFFVCVFDPRQILGFAFGHNYLAAAEALQILAVGSLLSVVIGPSPAALAGLGHARYNMAYGLASLVTNIALSLSLIPTMGLVGAAIAWSVARVIYPGLCLLHLSLGFRVDPFEGTFLRPLVASMVLLTPIFWIVHPFVIVYAFVPIMFFGAFALTLAVFPLTRSMESGDLSILGAFEGAVGVRFPRLRAYLRSREPPLPLAAVTSVSTPLSSGPSNGSR